MSESHGSHTDGHGHAASPAAPFSEAEMEEFHKDDRHAGGAVIVLMAAIFSIGLILYTVVASTVGTWPPYWTP
jgi:hypothetical protein